MRFAVLGDPISHSLSPAMHAAALARLGLSHAYSAELVSPHALPSALEDVRRGRWHGVNLTVPHKVSALAWMDEVDAEGAAVGAVNTVLRQRGRLVGTNTDAAGFRLSCAEAGVPLRDACVVVLGTGGAAHAVRHACAVEGARLRTAARRGGSGFDPDLALDDEAALASAFEWADVVVQATSAPLHPTGRAFAARLPFVRMRSHASLVELVVSATESPVVATARRHGVPVLDGVGMLAHQGAQALALWLGVDPSAIPVSVMKDAVRSALRTPP